MPRDTFQDASDETLLVLYANGDPSAARALTLRLTPKVFGHAYRVLGDRAEAEDVVQEAMLRLWKQVPNWRQGEAKVSTWVYRVVTNLCIDRQRRRKSVDWDQIDEPVDDSPDAAATLQTAARKTALNEALGHLPERQRTAVILRHIEGLANPEIAAIMDISPEAVESLTARGKRALAGVLSGQRQALGFEDD